MKKIVLIVLILAALMLSACVSSSTESIVTDTGQTATQSAETGGSTQSASSSIPSVLSTDYDNAASVDLQLLAGMLKLEGSNLAINKEQAIAILPLLAQYQSSRLAFNPGNNGQQNGNSNPQPTPSVDAQSKTDEAIAQIQSLLSADQLKAIADLKLTRESVQTILQDLGITQGAGTQMGGGNQPPQGNPPSDANNGGNAAPSNNDNQSPDNGQNPNAQGGNGQNGNTPAGNPPNDRSMVSPQLIEKLIEILNGKA